MASMGHSEISFFETGMDDSRISHAHLTLTTLSVQAFASVYAGIASHAQEQNMTFLLTIAAILSIGLMIGVEFAVWAFINPVLRQLENQPRAQAIVLFARNLGKTMPFWYTANLLFLLAEWMMLRHTPRAAWLAAAAVLWVMVIVLTLAFLVPINNRMAREETHAASDQAHTEHQRWDSLHRGRVIALGVAMVLFLVAVHV
jgi:uncharacterized membrane protein